MGITVYSSFWVMHDFDHQPYDPTVVAFSADWPSPDVQAVAVASFKLRHDSGDASPLRIVTTCLVLQCIDSLKQACRPVLWCSVKALARHLLWSSSERVLPMHGAAGGHCTNPDISPCQPELLGPGGRHDNLRTLRTRVFCR